MATVLPELFSNTASTTLASAISTTGATSISVAAGTGFPTASSTLGQFRIKIDNEIMLVTSGGASGTTWTVVRGVEGTTAATHSSGAAVDHVVTAEAVRRWAPSHTFQPWQNGTLAWTFPPSTGGAIAATGLSTRTVNVMKVFVPETITVANAHITINTGGSTLTTGGNMVGVYDSSGTLLCNTADQTSSWTSAGYKTMALSAASGGSLTLTGGPLTWYYAAIMGQGTTPPTVFRHGISALANTWVTVNGNLSGSYYAAYQTTLVTSGSGLPATLGALTVPDFSTNMFWIGLS
jgi:hypothetical protein